MGKDLRREALAMWKAGILKNQAVAGGAGKARSQATSEDKRNWWQFSKNLGHMRTTNREGSLWIPGR